MSVSDHMNKESSCNYNYSSVRLIWTLNLGKHTIILLLLENRYPFFHQLTQNWFLIGTFLRIYIEVIRKGRTEIWEAKQSILSQIIVFTNTAHFHWTAPIEICCSSSLESPLQDGKFICNYNIVFLLFEILFLYELIYSTK